MGLHVRSITPYALPGVLALLACWWFFSRKKDRRSIKPDRLSACVNEVATVDAQEELHNGSRAQLVLLDKEEEIVSQEDCTCSLPLAAQESLYSMQSNCRVKDDFVKESHLKKASISQGFSDQEVESKSLDNLMANEVAEIKEVVGVSMSSVPSQSLDDDKVVKHSSDNSVEKLCTISADLPCGCSQADEIQDRSLKIIDPKINVFHDSELLEVCFQTEALDDVPKNNVPVTDVCEIKDTMSSLPQAQLVDKVLFSREIELDPSEMVPECHDQNPIQKDPFIQQSSEVGDLGSEKPCSQSEGVALTQYDKSSVVFVGELDGQPSVAEMQVDKAESHVVEWCQSVANEMGLAFKGDVKLFETQSSETPSSESILSEQVTIDSALDLTTESHLKTDILQGVDTVIAGKPSESCVKSSVTEVVKESNCTYLLDTFSKCLEKKEESENLCPVVDDLKETHPKTYLGDYDAKIVEQIAMNLISKVIVAARQEILSSAVSDVSDSSCQILDENREVLTRETQYKQVVPESEEDLVSASFSLGVMDFDCTCESAQFEPLQNKDLNTELTGDEFCLEHQREEQHNPPSTSARQMPSVSDISPVHRRTDFFEESQPALEDSSLSVCTSEECINMDDPLQSTVLSTVSGGYDSLSSSGIELSRETFNMSIEKPMKAACGENDKELYTNGDLKRCSPDLNHEGTLATESEVDHSGGSDVNSMDSVDSGYALGNSEQFQNVKQKSDAKKADLVIWEFEVPKYLVGRLIGKQGRFVSFLKQSSGAKIYISTVPYTQDIQICHLEGSQQQIDRALSLIRKKFKDLNLTNIFAPPPPLIPLPVASWLTLPNNVSVEVVVVNVVNAGHMFVQQRTHPTFHALCGLDQHMSLCYSQPGIPTLPTPAEVGILCAAPVGPSVWWRAQVMAYFEDTEEVEILYVDYGGYNRVKIDTLRQIRSDFVSLPFQGVEVLLDNVIPLGDEDHFSAEADAAVKELTRGAPMLTQVTNYDEATRLPLVQLWRLNPDEMVSVNRTLVERGFAEWIDGY